jgi:4-hydroxybenzoate polyprenyltransferase
MTTTTSAAHGSGDQADPSAATPTTRIAPAPPSAPPSGAGARLVAFARDIKLSHTLFALPFALLSTFLAANGWPRTGQLLLILLCMVSARTVAMASNRLVDAELDRRNPRTAGRAIPSGRLSRGFFIAALVVCGLAFVAATSLFGAFYRNWLPLILAVPVLAFIAAYPLLKRFTQLCHYYLGASLALAPICAWIAITGRVDVEPLLMAGAVLCWTAGFDIIYACQDFEVDRAQGLYSVPARIGIGPALWVSRFTHALALLMLIALGWYSQQLQFLYFIGVWITAALLFVEHALVRPGDLSRVGVAFFLMNGMISLVLGTLGILDVFF